MLKVQHHDKIFDEMGGYNDMNNEYTITNMKTEQACLR